GVSGGGLQIMLLRVVLVLVQLREDPRAEVRQRLNAVFNGVVTELVRRVGFFLSSALTRFDDARTRRARAQDHHGRQRQPYHKRVETSTHLPFKTLKAQSRRSGTGSNQPLTLFGEGGNLLLPGALLVPVQAQLLAPFVFVDFGFPTFFQ